VIESLSLPRRIARAVFLGLGAISLFLTFALLAVDRESRGVTAKHDWSNAEFQDLAIGLWHGVSSGVILLVAAYFLRSAKLRGLIILTICNLLLLVFILPAYGKDQLVALPLGVSLFALFFEDFRILTGARGERA